MNISIFLYMYRPINIKIQKKDSGIFEIENILN